MAQQTWPYPGARWWKFDFHTHTPASKDWDKANSGQNPPTPEQWLLQYMQAEIDCVAITDHNSGDWIDKLKSAYEKLGSERPKGFRELHLFPGVELSVNGGIHLLAIFEKGTASSHIVGLLSKVDYQGTEGDSDGVTSESIVKVIKAVVDAGGVAIPAHVDEPKGLLKLYASGSAKPAFDANTIRQVFDCGHVFAMEVSDRTVPKPEIYSNSKCKWTEVLGSDCHDFHGHRSPGSRFTWVKMAEPSLEGLRLALMDGDQFSIRRSDAATPFDPYHLPNHVIESIEVKDARYMGRGEPAVLTFSPWFNAVVGGRGTGKSTFVHALRLVYRRSDEISKLTNENEARRTFEQFKREPQNRNDESGALDYKTTRKTEIRAIVRRDELRHRLSWLQRGNGTAVEDESGGQWTPSSSQSITGDRFPIRILSQGQIVALAGESQAALIALIDEAAKIQPATAALEEATNRYYTLRTRIREFDAKLKGRDDLHVSLVDVQRKLATFEGKQHAEILRAYQQRTRQSREIDRQLDAATQLADRLLQDAERLSADNIPEGLFDAANEVDQGALAVVERLHTAIADAATAVREAGVRLRAVANQERLGLPTREWFVATVEARTKYALLTQELKQEGAGDPAEYGKLVQERQRLEMEIDRLDAIDKELGALRRDAIEQRAAVRIARQAISQGRESFLKTELSQNNYVRIELLRYGRGSRSLEGQLREVLGANDDRFEKDILLSENNAHESGLIVDLLRDLPEEADSAAVVVGRRVNELSERLEKACNGKGDFGGNFNNFLQREAANRPEFLDRLLLWSPEDSLKVEYSPKGDGKEFRPILQASAGQRAAAMLAFLLAYGDEPLVLDQPEDDLDNHLIYELVVQQIRENKLRRQIIVVTHNPNIVVNGDAEMLHALHFKAGQCRIQVAGSLLEVKMREEVCKVMEGGQEAFQRRYRRLGGETGHV